MTENILTQLLTLIGAILAAALGGYLAIRATRIQITHQEKLEKHQRDLERLERLHATLSRLARQAQQIQIGVHAKVTRGLTLNEEKWGGHVTFSDLFMLVDFYAPSLRQDADAIRGGFDQLFHVAAEAIDLKETRSPVDDLLRDCNGAANGLQRQILESQEKLGKLAGALR